MGGRCAGRPRRLEILKKAAERACSDLKAVWLTGCRRCERFDPCHGAQQPNQRARHRRAGIVGTQAAHGSIPDAPRITLLGATPKSTLQ